MFDLYVHSQNVLFIHIPKCAGQSICNFFFRLNNDTWDNRGKYLMFQNGNPELGPPQVAHFTIHDYRKSDLLNDLTIDNAIKFAIVRNPFDRLWSTYNFYWKHICSWDEFFKYFPDYIFDDHSTGRDALRHIMPQHEFVDETVELLSFENLQVEFRLFCFRHNIPFIGFYDRLNVSESVSFEEVYDPAKIKAVEAYYTEDLDRFGYRAPKP